MKVVFVNDVAFLCGDPQGAEGMPADLVGDGGPKESGGGWLWVARPPRPGLCRSTQPVIWFGSLLQSYTNKCSMLGTLEHPVMCDLY